VNTTDDSPRTPAGRQANEMARSDFGLPVLLLAVAVELYR
jgi:hypothetical protein